MLRGWERWGVVAPDVVHEESKALGHWKEPWTGTLPEGLRRDSLGSETLRVDFGRDFAQNVQRTVVAKMSHWH